jgi:gliding motility-associated-like protein
LKLQDAAGCSVNSSVLIAQPEPLKAIITTQPSYCNLSNGNVSAAVSGGQSPYLFNWAPVTSTMPALANVYAGNYQLMVTDNNNCHLSITTTIPNDVPRPVFLGNDTTLCPGNRMILSPGIYNSYRWQDNSVSPDYLVTNGGIYTVEVIDNLSCVLKDTINIISDCGFIFFPNAFTPNNDLQNDLFGPAGYLNTVKDYTLLIYNRLGQLVFTTSDPLKKWDGRMQDKSRLPGTYVWIARYSNKGVKNILQKGTVTVIY